MNPDPNPSLEPRPRQDDTVPKESPSPPQEASTAGPTEEGEIDVTQDIVNNFPAMFLIGVPMLYAVHVASGMPPARRCTVGIEDMLALPALAVLTFWLWFRTYRRSRPAMSRLSRILNRLPFILVLGCLGADFFTHHFHRYFRP